MRTRVRHRWTITRDLSALRGDISRYAVDAGLTGRRLDDLLLAAHEAAVNVLRHAGGEGTVTVWHDDVYVTVDVTDRCGLLSMRDARRERPDGNASGGLGLWLMRELCDEFTIEQRAGGSRVRLRMLLATGALP
ncbi:hypothetical protein GCM10010517_12050 [Streptosporangium fragile]|uniref:Histidine kinase/HSP90-like ATPase domain-containing protein n=1 Tax=Streptosporangium fragile TaxID=46186 RepID=A0ABP6I7W6_9ACTN